MRKSAVVFAAFGTDHVICIQVVDPNAS
jgi:hypothetical protein